MIGRPRKACLQCNSQKLRCPGPRPLCDRCKRIGRVCRWSDGATGGPKPVRRASSTVQLPSLSSSLPGPNKAGPTEPVETSAPVADSASSYTGIPLSVVLRLVDVYFSCLYSAPLMFHKATLLDELAAGKVKAHVILSTCALASSLSGSSHEMRNNLRDDGFSKEWAERAGRLALAEAEKPSQDTVVSFTNLGLFWYSQGQWRRSLVYEGYASLNSRALLLWSAADMSPLEAELSRRRFWASFLLNQFISEPVFPKILRNSVGDIPLPIPEEDYNSGNVPTPSATLNKGARDGSIFAELVRVMSLWVDIYETIKDSTHADPSGLAAIQVLSARLNEWHSQLHGSLRLAADGTSSCSSDIRPQVMLLHATYHQCLCALHCSIVPLFSLSKAPESESYVLGQRLSAQVAFDNAGAISDLVRASLTRDPAEAYRWPGFVGFALYCSCAIQLPYLWCADVDDREVARANIRDNLSAMASIGRNWRYVAGLVNNVKTLYQYRSSHPIPLRGAPMSLSVSELAGRREGEPRALSSTIGGGNDSLWKHRSRMEQSKLANVDQQDENTAYAPGRNAAVHAHAPTHLGQDDTPLLAADVNVQVVGGEPTTSCFLPVEPRTAQPYVPTILSSLFPGDSVNYGLEVDSGHAEFLPAMMRSGDMAPFDDHEQAIASWFDG